MKKRISILLCVVLATALLASCASSGGNATAPMRSGGGDSWDTAAPAPEAFEGEMFFSSGTSSGSGSLSSVYTDSSDDGGWYEPVSGEEDTIMPISAAEAFVEKIIYSVYADIETITFDDTIDKVHALMQNYGAFIENSSISGVNYSSRMHGWVEYRYAHFSLRVPKENLDGITANLDNLGNVTHRNSNASNITSQFYDTQSRLNSLRIQEERLLDMLSKAADVPDLIMIEERLSDVRYQVETLTTTLNNWQQQVDFSTLTLSIREVEEYTEQVLIHRTYWQQIGDGFMASIRSVGKFFMDLFRWLIVSAPVLILLAGIGVVIYIIVRRIIRAADAKRKNAPANAYPAYVYPPPQQYPHHAQQMPQPAEPETAETESQPEQPEQPEQAEEQSDEQPEEPENQPEENESQSEQNHTENEHE